MPHVTIVWFRNDLRLDDQPSLRAAVARGAIVPLFIHAPEEEVPWEPGAASRWWLHGARERFAAALAEKGAPLLIRRGPSLATLLAVAREYGATHVAWNRRYEPAVIGRDTAIKEALKREGLVAESFNGGQLFEPVHVATKEGKPYQVFTPFWRALLARDEPAEPEAAPAKILAAKPVGKTTKPVGKTTQSIAIAALDLLPAIDWAAGMRERWTPGEAAAAVRLDHFLEHLDRYDTDRDRPDHDGTSALSPHLHFGEISPRRVWHAVRAAVGGRPAARIERGGAETYLRELGWREFATHLLYHFPHTPQEPLRGDYARFPWVDDPAGLRAWQRGQTGYPIVDAGMRQLWQTGWMHNRVRMIVASFLVKDLRVSWLTGARWFWDTLVDANLAANTLGWQWAGGCGADAAPYFRIFNPQTQGERFDPDGAYVRTFVPELKGLPAADIHAPGDADTTTLARAGIKLGSTYPEQIVNHAEARVLALAALKIVTAGKEKPDKPRGR